MKIPIPVSAALIASLFCLGTAKAQKITSFTPAKGSPGTLITVTGTGLANTQFVLIGGNNSTIVTSTNDTKATAMVSYANNGKVSVVSKGNGFRDTNKTSFTSIVTHVPSVQQGDKITATEDEVSLGKQTGISADGNTMAALGMLAAGTHDWELGRIWIYTRSADTWTLQQAALAPTSSIGGKLTIQSFAISADGNTIYAGGNSIETGYAAVWMFTRTGSSWAQTAEFLPPNNISTQRANAMAVSADARTFAVSYTEGTAVYYNYDAGWNMQAHALSGTAGNIALSADGLTLLVANPQANSSAGQTLVFVSDRNFWTQKATFVGTPTIAGNQQGTSLAVNVDGNTIAIGDLDGVFIFDTSGFKTWAQEPTKIVPGGSSVALSTDGKVLLTSNIHDNHSDAHSTLWGYGAVWAFRKTDTGWAQFGNKLTGLNPSGTFPQMGNLALSQDGTTVAAGGIGDNFTYTDANNNQYGKGAVWMFKSVDTTNTITFTLPDTSTYGNTIPLNAVSTDKTWPITYVSSNDNIARVVDDSLKFFGVGTVTITASQPNPQNPNPPAPVSRTITSKKAPLTIKPFDQSVWYHVTDLAIPPNIGYYITGLKNGDARNIVEPNLSTYVTDSLGHSVSDPLPGNYKLVPFIQGVGNDPKNYDVTFIPGVYAVKAYPAPVITSFTPTVGTYGSSITITGDYFHNVTSVTIGGTIIYGWVNQTVTQIVVPVSGATSGDVTVNTTHGTFSLSGFKYYYNPSITVKATALTCPGANNGIITVSISDQDQSDTHFTVTVSGPGVNKSYLYNSSGSSGLNIDSLATGSYSVCVTIPNQTFSQCYTVDITQPANLFVTSVVNDANLTLTMDGGTQYAVMLNGKTYTTSQDLITLPLQEGDNQLQVTTDRLCQGLYTRVITVKPTLKPFPVPFQNTLSLDLGTKNIGNLIVQLNSVSNGKIVLSKQFVNQSGVIQLDVTDIKTGVYALKVHTDNIDKTFKIIKK